MKTPKFSPALLAPLIALAWLAQGSLPATAQSGVYTPKPGSPKRKAIMDTLRVPVEHDLKMPVIFVVTDPKTFFRVKQGWAFVGPEFRHSNGDPMGPAYYAEANDSDVVIALLHRVHGKWHVVTHDTGAVDVEWPEWSAKYHTPPGLLP